MEARLTGLMSFAGPGSLHIRTTSVILIRAYHELCFNRWLELTQDLSQQVWFDLRDLQERVGRTSKKLLCQMRWHY